MRSVRFEGTSDIRTKPPATQQTSQSVPGSRLRAVHRRRARIMSVARHDGGLCPSKRPAKNQRTVAAMSNASHGSHCLSNCVR